MSTLASIADKIEIEAWGAAREEEGWLYKAQEAAEKERASNLAWTVMPQEERGPLRVRCLGFIDCRNSNVKDGSFPKLASRVHGRPWGQMQ